MSTVRAWNWREPHKTIVEGESRTVQSHRDTSDVNYIVNRYQRTGELPRNPRGIEGQYRDITHLQEEELTELYNLANTRAEVALEELNRREQEAEEAKEAKEAEEAAAQAKTEPEPDFPATE